MIMDMARKVLDAVPGCQKAFVSDTPIIKAAKNKFSAAGVKASNGAGIEMANVEDETNTAANECANIASFSINTYEWDPYIGENKAGGTVAIYLSSASQETQPSSAVVLSIRVNKNRRDRPFECTF